jgi:CRP/FNR family transcriptional regulator
MAAANVNGPLYQPQRAGSTTESNLISGLSRASLDALTKVATWREFPRGQQVYREGDKATGVYIVLRGKVKLISDFSEGKTLILRIARPGEMISLSAALSSRNNDTSAETTEPSTLCFIATANLRQVMTSEPEVGLRMARELSIEYSSLCQGLSTIGLQRSAMSRLAKLLFDMTGHRAPQHHSQRHSQPHPEPHSQQGAIVSTCPLTHQEMSQIIGTSRETVTRLLQDLRSSGIACVKRDTLTVNRPERLQALTN